MKYVEEARAGGEMKLLTEAIHTTNCEEHGNRRAQSKEVTGSEDQLWVADHWYSGTTTTDDEIHGCIGCRS